MPAHGIIYFLRLCAGINSTMDTVVIIIKTLRPSIFLTTSATIVHDVISMREPSRDIRIIRIIVFLMAGILNLV